MAELDEFKLEHGGTTEPVKVQPIGVPGTFTPPVAIDTQKALDEQNDRLFREFDRVPGFKKTRTEHDRVVAEIKALPEEQWKKAYKQRRKELHKAGYNVEIIDPELNYDEYQESRPGKILANFERLSGALKGVIWPVWEKLVSADISFEGLMGGGPFESPSGTDVNIDELKKIFSIEVLTESAKGAWQGFTLKDRMQYGEFIALAKGVKPEDLTTLEKLKAFVLDIVADPLFYIPAGTG